MQTALGVMSGVVFFCSQLRVVVAEHMLVVMQLLGLYLVLVVVVALVVQQLLLWDVNLHVLVVRLPIFVHSSIFLHNH